jgi:hypothetical protein
LGGFAAQVVPAPAADPELTLAVILQTMHLPFQELVAIFRIATGLAFI